MIKKAVKWAIRRFGYDIRKRQGPNLDLYDGFPIESLNQRRFYNIGSGLFQHPYWTNIDYATEHYSIVQKHEFINYDLMRLEQLPLEDESAEIVYSSHTIEHVSAKAVLNMLKESYRILKPNGYVRLTTPDMNLSYQAYKRNDFDFWYWRKWYSEKGKWEQLFKIPLTEASIPQLFLYQFASELSEVSVTESKKKYSDNEIIAVLDSYSLEEAIEYFSKQCDFDPLYAGNHISGWTHDKLLSFLTKAGFSNVYGSGYGQSHSPALRDTDYFDNTHPKISLFMEAQKGVSE